MGFIKNLFTKSELPGKSTIKPNWKSLNSVEQLNEIKAVSEEKTVFIFKHSTRCGISRMVLRQFEEGFKPNSNIELYFLDLLAHRDISNAVAEQFKVWHESPQLLIIEKGACIKHASHYAINEVYEF